MGNKMIKAVVFDIGGVLAFDIWEHLFLDPEKGLAAILSLPPDEVKQMGLKMWEDFAYKSAKSEKEINALEIDYWSQFKRHFRRQDSLDFFLARVEEFIRPVKNMLSLVQKLKENGIELAICSNNTEFFHKRLCEKLKLMDTFDPAKEVLSSRVGFSKTSENFEMFHRVEQVVSVHKNETVLVDDRIPNIERAIAFGMNAILFPAASEKGADYLERLFLQMGVFE